MFLEFLQEFRKRASAPTNDKGRESFVLGTHAQNAEIYRLEDREIGLGAGIHRTEESTSNQVLVAI